MKELKKEWYFSVSKQIYEKYNGLRLTDSQLARVISNNFGGDEQKHLSNIRRSRCNNKDVDYVFNSINYLKLKQ